MTAARGPVLSFDNRSRPGDRRTPRSRRRAAVSSGLERSERRESSGSCPARGFGRGTITSRSRPPRVTPIASGFGNRSPPLCSDHIRRSKGSASGARSASALWPRFGPRDLARRARERQRRPAAKLAPLAFEQAADRERAGDPVSLVDEHTAEDQRRRQPALGRGPCTQWAGEHVCRQKVTIGHLLGAQVELAQLDRDAVGIGVRACRRDAPPGRSRAPAPAPSRASQPTIASTPEPQPRSTNEPPPRAEPSSSSSRHSRVVAWAPVPNA